MSQNLAKNERQDKPITGLRKPTPLKRFAAINTQVLPESTPDDYEIEYIDISSVDSRGASGVNERYRFVDAPSRARRVVKPGDTIISTVRTYLKAIAFFETCPSNLIASTGFAVLSPPQNTVPKYLYYVVQDDTFITSVTIESKGVNYPAITSNEIGAIKVEVTTSLDEQELIVRYLDIKNAEIDAFVERKRRLIELLSEQKTAVAAKILTQGSERGATTKASGTMFLGDVPSHWEVRRARFYFREVNQRSENGTEELLSVSHITGVTPRSGKNVNMFLAESYEGSKLCEAGDIVINTMWAWMGALGVAKQIGIVSPSYGVYRQRNPLNFLSEYLDYLLRVRAYVDEYTCRSSGIHDSRLRMYPEDFFNVRIISTAT